jgi:hypothetical protein
MALFRFIVLFSSQEGYETVRKIALFRDTRQRAELPFS